MNSYILYPGEGLPIDIEYSVDVNTWTVTGELRNRLTGAVISSGQGGPDLSIVVTRISNRICRFHITSTITNYLAGKQFILKMVAVNPNVSAEPVVDEALITVSSV